MGSNYRNWGSIPIRERERERGIEQYTSGKLREASGNPSHSLLHHKHHNHTGHLYERQSIPTQAPYSIKTILASTMPPQWPCYLQHPAKENKRPYGLLTCQAQIGIGQVPLNTRR